MLASYNDILLTTDNFALALSRSGAKKEVV
jgi:hypothetical protein